MSDFDFDEIDKAVNSALQSTPGATPNTEATTEPTPGEPAVVPAATTSASAPTSAPAARRTTGPFMDIAHPSFAVLKQTTQEIPVPSPMTQSTPRQLSADLVVPADPLESPFIPDAKVEKRPLGGEAPTAVEPDTPELLEAPNEPRLEAHTMPDPIDFAAPEPDDAPVAQHVTSAPERQPEFQPTVDPASTPVAIAQQYQELPSEPAQTGAIFDTETYHQPLVHASKKRSGNFAILWILLIVIGGGAGAAAYFLIMPQL
jgi:hypothetical protein